MASPFEAQFVSAGPVYVDYTPAADTPAGSVVVVNDTPRIAHRFLPANVLGAVAAEGGVYEVKGDGVIAADKKVYWDDTANKATLTSTSNKVLGVSVTNCTGDGAYFHVRHDPAQ